MKKIMSTKSNSRMVLPYLSFEGRCAEAVGFYRKTLGAEVTALVHFKDCPDAGMCAPGMGDKVMHTSLRIGETTLLASDGRCSGKARFEGVSLSLTVGDQAEADQLFAALSDGGQVVMPLSPTPFSPHFGMVADRFGVSWMVHVAPEDRK